jgi:integrase
VLIITVELTGSRPGELLGCIWKDYDFDSGILTIHRRLEKHSRMIKDTKTHQKRSTYLVTPNQIALLGQYKNSKFRKSGDFIWPKQTGRPLSKSLVNHRFKKSLQRFGLREIMLYDLRHGDITELLNDGVPNNKIQERVGYASATITKDRYGHFLPSAQEKSTRKWERTRLKNRCF